MTKEINAYSNARKVIHSWLNSHNIPRNDNIVGRIGEFFAIEYMKNTYSKANVVVTTISNQEGYDFLVDDKRYSVKTITKENRTGSTTPIKFNKTWDFLVAVRLDVDFNVESLSVIDYPSIKNVLDENSRKQGKVPGIKKTFRWWKVLNENPYKKI